MREEAPLYFNDERRAYLDSRAAQTAALNASTYSCTRVDELSTNEVRIAQLSCVDSQTRGRLRCGKSEQKPYWGFQESQ